MTNDLATLRENRHWIEYADVNSAGETIAHFRYRYSARGVFTKQRRLMDGRWQTVTVRATR